MDQGFSAVPPQVGPWQLHGIEINPYAYDLAQMTVWIGYLQWMQINGFGEPQEPILQALDDLQLHGRDPRPAASDGPETSPNGRRWTSSSAIRRFWATR